MRESFFHGALLLTIGSLVSRLLGFVYRIWVVRLIGAEGIGIYEMVFPIITLVLVLTTAGIPVALANLVANYKGEGNDFLALLVTRYSFVLLSISGILLPAIIMQVAPWLLAKVFADPRAYWSFMTLLPVIFFVSISSVFRGYFQGIGYMLPIALGQFLEQILRFSIGIFLVIALLPYGLEFSAAGLGFAVLIGEFGGVIVLLLFYLRKTSSKRKLEKKNFSTIPTFSVLFKELAVLALPVTLSRVISSSMLSIKAVMIPNRLQVAGATLEQATQAYGALSGMAMSLISFPTVITGSLSAALLPAIAIAIKKENYQELTLRVNQGIKFTIFIALPFVIWFFLLSEPIFKTLYKSSDASILLRLLAPSCIFLYLQQTTVGILYGLGRMKTLLFNSLIANCLSLVSTYWLVANPFLAIKGAAISFVVGAFINCILNLFAVTRYAGVYIKVKEYITPFTLASVCMILFVVFLKNLLSLYVNIICSGLLYLICGFIFTIFTKKGFIR